MNRDRAPATAFRPGLALALAAVCLAFAPPTGAQAIPSGGTALVSGDVATVTTFYANTVTGGPVATRSTVDVPDRPFARAARIATLRPNGDFWSSALTLPTNRAVADRDVVLLRFFVRAIETTDESGQATCQLYVEGPAPNYRKSISTEIRAGLEWTEYLVPFAVDGAYAAGELGVKFGFGATGRAQVLELGGVEAWWYGQTRSLAELPRTSFQYEGRSPHAPWRAAAAARIEQHRKGGYSLRVLNRPGQPVPGATVRVRQLRHAFEFGTAIDGRRLVNTTDANNAVYREALLELFNAGTLENDLKWPPWIGEWGTSYSQPIALAALRWASDRQLRLRGHVLVWPSTRNLPSSLTARINASDPTIPATILAHIDDILAATRDYVSEWDVLNEPYDNHDIMDRYGDAQMIEWFKRARAGSPQGDLYINDYAILSGNGLNTAKQDAYERTIRYIRDGGGPLTGVGFQGHFSGAPTGMTRLWSILQRYATAFPDLKFRITEYDFVTDDEALQADYTRDLYTLAFSHPQMHGIQMWGFWEGAHWRASAAMLRQDWTDKPMATAYRRLVLGDWWTDVTTTSSPTGRVAGRGFLGSYIAEISHAGQTATRNFELTAAGTTADITLALDSAAPTISTPPLGATLMTGGSVTLTVAATGAAPLGYQWRKDGRPLDGATGPALVLAAAQPEDSGLYTVAVTNPGGTVVSDAAAVGVIGTAKTTAGGSAVGADIVHPNGNIYDQVLVTGPSVTITADPRQVTRTSFIDLSDDIVQVEFSGAGSLTLSLAAPTGPATPALYHQPTVAYLKGHASVTIAGADETTHVSIFTVGPRTAVNQSLFRAETHYDGVADVAALGIRSTNGRFGSVRCANTEFGGRTGLVGLHAPGIDFDGPVYVHNVSAADDATPSLLTGAVATGSIGITGGDLAQANLRPIRVGTVAAIQMRAGETSHGVAQPAQVNRGVLERDGVDVTTSLVRNP